MGRVATELADFAVITSDNPRSEEPLDIIRDIEAGIIKDNYCIVPERATAIKKALSLAKNGDIVLIAGKGHENYQVFKNKTVHFDDREAVSACLR
jgi:UDP-N-acetylmuramoyl-L-alanyl-D-glutamate--2,6-diaminopimelate ligase